MTDTSDLEIAQQANTQGKKSDVLVHSTTQSKEWPRRTGRWFMHDGLCTVNTARPDVAMTADAGPS
jgi:hypothetical protein